MLPVKFPPYLVNFWQIDIACHAEGGSTAVGKAFCLLSEWNYSEYTLSEITAGLQMNTNFTYVLKIIP